MLKYIDADEAKLRLSEAQKQVQPGGVVNPCGVIDSIPAANVAEVRCGQWREYQTLFGEYLECPYCGFKINTDHILYTYRYCPNCGAKMDEKDGGDGDD